MRQLHEKTADMATVQKNYTDGWRPKNQMHKSREKKKIANSSTQCWKDFRGTDTDTKVGIYNDEAIQQTRHETQRLLKKYENVNAKR